MKRLFGCLFYCTLRLSARAQADASAYPYVYQGVIETNSCQRLPICLNFLVCPDRTIIGSYYYQRPVTTLKLRGRLQADNSFVLTERDHNGTITGYFEGGLSSDSSTPRRATGRWHSPSGAITFAFQATQLEPTSYQGYVFRYRKLREYTHLAPARDNRSPVRSIDWERRGLRHVPRWISRLPSWCP